MYTEIVLLTERSFAEALSDALLEAGALSAAIEDADAGTGAEEALFGEPGGEPAMPAWRTSRIIALFEDGAEIDSALRAAGTAAGLAGLPSWTARAVPEVDWVRLTQAQFEPLKIGARLWIVPSWHALPDEAKRDKDAVILTLDPGLAFGTGAHPTTRLCLEWLEDNVRPGQTVVDYGCGSGILAIAAKKFGAKTVIGTDIDAQAIRASIDNARDNRCEVTFTSSEDLHAGCAEIVIANILSNPLQLLAPLLSGLVAPGGWLVLSGVLARQAEEVIAVYKPWLALKTWRLEEGWVCLVGQQRRGEVN